MSSNPAGDNFFLFLHTSCQQPRLGVDCIAIWQHQTQHAILQLYIVHVCVLMHCKYNRLRFMTDAPFFQMWHLLVAVDYTLSLEKYIYTVFPRMKAALE